MGSYRSRFDIIADILVVASRDAKKTQIMYQANLSYKVLQRYLNEITGACLIRFEHTHQCYMLTSKGQEYLDVYRDYSRANRSIEKRLNDFSTKKKLLEDLCSLPQPSN